MVREGRGHTVAGETVMQVVAPVPSRSWRHALTGLLLVSPPFLLMLFLIVAPTVQAILYSTGQVPTDNIVFQSDIDLVSSATPTLVVYQRLLSSPYVQADLAMTFQVTIASVVLVLVVGYILALYVRFSTGLLPSIVRVLYLIPMFIPVVIASYGLIEFFVANGFLQTILAQFGIQNMPSPIYTPWGIVLGQVWTGIPFAVLLLGSGLDGVPQELIEAAQDVGASFGRILWRIVTPQVVTPLLIVGTFTFIGVLGSYTVPYLIGPNAPQMLGVAMTAYNGSYQRPQPAVAMAVLTFLIATVAGAIYVWGTSRTERTAA
ncbi:MAG: ABC transporter permease subunit [Chloroflexi bacterium]|nr:ABC transporter permease subunit [Chloroflexota bacterium]